MIAQVNKIMVTNNEFLNIQKEEANIYWRKIFSIDSSADEEEIKRLKALYLREFEGNLDKYEVIPFENNNDSIKKILNTYFNSDDNRGDYTHYKGSLFGDYSSYMKILNTLNLNELIDTGYYRAAYNPDTKIIFEYCEGDIFMQIANNETAFKRLLDNTIKFINDNY